MDYISLAQQKVIENSNKQNLKLIFSCLDLTSLSSTDTIQSIDALASKVAQLPLEFKGVPMPASVCVYPVFIDAVGLALGESDVAITSVAGGFPASQTYLEVKMLETAMAVENGADEIDVVISLGEFLSGDFDNMASEIQMLKAEVGDDVVLKTIIESGELKSTENIYKASMLCMDAGADFIKTSTGKTAVSATPEAVVAVCNAIKDYFEATERRVGLKVAGGVKTTADALLYFTLVELILGQQWLKPSLFRIGASSLANEILSDITDCRVAYF